MKAKIFAFSFLLLGGAGSALAQEEDDMYFFTSDREKLNETVSMNISTPDEPSAPVSFTRPEGVARNAVAPSQNSSPRSNVTIVSNYYGVQSPFYAQPYRSVNRFGYNTRFNGPIGYYGDPFFNPYAFGYPTAFRPNGSFVQIGNINSFGSGFGFGSSVGFNRGFAGNNGFGFGAPGGGFGGNINSFGSVSAYNAYCPPGYYGGNNNLGNGSIGSGNLGSSNTRIPSERARGGSRENVVYAPTIDRESRRGSQVGVSSGNVPNSTRTSSATIGRRSGRSSTFGNSSNGTRSRSINSSRSGTRSRSYTPSRTRSYTPSKSTRSRSYSTPSPSRSRSSSTGSSSPSRSRSGSSGSSGGSRSRGGRGGR